jgi:hypothetical protein
MNDFAKGAIEALAWTRTVLEKTGSTKAKQQVEKALDTILDTISEDFPIRITV